MKIIEQLKARKQNQIQFDQVLFGKRIGAYVWTRIKWVALSSTILWGIYLIKLYLLRDHHKISELFSLVMLEQMGLFLLTGWWGLLDIVRSKLAWVPAGQRINLIQSWYSKSLCFAAMAFITISSILIYFENLELPRTNIQVLTTWFLIIKICCEIPLLLLHSCSFSFRRVYFPGKLVVLQELISLAIVLGLSPTFGPWSLFWSYATGGMFHLSIKLVMYLKSYSKLRLPLNALKFSFKSLFDNNSRLNSIEGAISSALIACITRAPSTIIFIFIYFMKMAKAQHIFLLVSPMIFFSASWPHLMHFDFRKYAGPPWKNLLGYAESKILKYVVIIGILVGVLSNLVSNYLLETSNFMLVPLCLTFSCISFLSMSQLAQLQGKIAFQMQNFCNYGSIQSQGLFEKILLSRIGTFKIFYVELPEGSKKGHRVRRILIQKLSGQGLILQLEQNKLLWVDWRQDSSPDQLSEWIVLLHGYAHDLQYLGNFTDGMEAVKSLTLKISQMAAQPKKEEVVPLLTFLKIIKDQDIPTVNLKASILHGQPIHFSQQKFEAVFSSGEVSGLRKMSGNATDMKKAS